MRSFYSLLNRFRRDQRGNIAVIFGIACIPLISAVGCAIDYSEATRMKAKLQSAADAAAVASISQQSPGWLAASNMTSNGEVTVAETAATNIFNGNITGANNTLFTLNAKQTTATVTKTGPNLTSTVTFSANVPVTFMKVVGFSQLTVSGSSSASATLPLYIDFYVALDVSASMGLPSTSSPNGGEAKRLQSISPDNYVQYPSGCTLACHFAQPPLNNLKSGACIDPSPNTPTGATPTQKYPTGNYCLGYDISRVSQSAYALLLSNNGGKLPTYKYTPKTAPAPPAVQVAQPAAFYSVNPLAPNDPILTPVTSCPTAGTDACIQLRLDAVGVALNATQAVNGVDGLFATAINPLYAQVPQQFRIGLYPFITAMDTNYAPLTYSINASSTTPGTINYAAQNLAMELDTNSNSNLGSGGTHIDVALHTLNGVITSVGDGSSPTSTQPYIFLITDGAQDPQSKGVPNGNWSGSNHAVTLGDASNTYPNICTTIKNRGIMISVLNIPYQPINPVNASFANDEDDYANNNILGPPGPGIQKSLDNCASPPDSQGVGYSYTANTPTDITNALKAMFQHALMTAHITH
jgi:Flp pilus assembly protein TadG